MARSPAEGQRKGSEDKRGGNGERQAHAAGRGHGRGLRDCADASLSMSVFMGCVLSLASLRTATTLQVAG
ncbi:MAG: hypothetical protein ABI538_07495 [Pseudoxanthomonas sp.]